MRDYFMDMPAWLKPGIYGAVCGAAAFAIAGFSWAGWVTGGSAKEMAGDAADSAVLAALVPICVSQAQADPDSTAKITAIKGESSYKRSDKVIEAGWATMPGSTDANKVLARACATELTN